MKPKTPQTAHLFLVPACVPAAYFYEEEQTLSWTLLRT